MADNKDRGLIIHSTQAQALTEVRQFENRLLEKIAPELEINPAIICRPAEGVRNIVFTPDGRYIAASIGRSIQIWNCHTSRCVQVLNGHTSGIRSLAVTPDGDRFLSSCHGEIILWDRKTGQPLWVKEEKASNQLILGLDGQTFIHGTYRGVVFCDVNSGERIRSLSTSYRSIAGPLAVSADGKRVAAAYFDIHAIDFIDLDTGEESIHLSGHSGPVKTLEITKDGRTLISGSKDNNLRLWDLESKRSIGMLVGHYGAVTSLILTSDESRVISGSEDRTIRIWDLQNKTQEKVLLGNLAEVQALAVSPDGNVLASGGSDSSIVLWNLATGQAQQTLVGLTRSVTAVDLSHDELMVVCTDSAEKVVRIRKYTQDGGCSYGEVHLLEHRKNTGTAISPDHKMISVGGRKVIYLFDIESGRLIRKLNGHTDFCPALRFSPDGRWLFSASASLDKTWRIWDIQTGECLKAVNGRAEGQVGLYAFAFHPDGKRFLLSGVAEVSIWDINTGKHLRKVLSKHNPHMIMALAIHPDGKRFVTGAWDEKIREWDLETGEQLRTLEGHQRIVSSLAFNQDGRLLISGSEGGLVNFWDYEKNELLATAHNVDGGYLWTTPPDKFARNGWLYTDRPDLVGLTSVNPGSGEVEYISEDDQRFINYMQLYNDGQMVMDRIKDWDRYQELLMLRSGNKHDRGMKMIAARIKTDQLFQLDPGSAVDTVEKELIENDGQG